MSTFTGFKDYPDNSTPLSAEFLNALLDKMYPLGKVEVFFDNLDHSDYLGFTWERTCIGRTPVGIDTTQTEFDTIGETGGEKNHTLTINEIPTHTHPFYYAAENGSGWGINLNWSSKVPGGLSDPGAGQGIGSRGGNQAHNNLQPYQVFAFWKRVEASE